MVHGLPKWIILGAFILSFSAGMTNSLVLSNYRGDAVSHMTGNISNFAIRTVNGDSSSINVGLILLSFVVGACMSGILIGSEKLKIGRRYGVALIIESALLFTAWLFLSTDQIVGIFLAAIGCGLQNAMVSTYSGATIRTTHMTGILSDLGSILGNLICRRPINTQHSLLLIDILLGFISGAFGGMLIFKQLGWYTMLLPVVLYFSTGLAYLIYRYYLFFTNRGIVARQKIETNQLTKD